MVIYIYIYICTCFVSFAPHVVCHVFQGGQPVVALVSGGEENCRHFDGAPRRRGRPGRHQQAQEGRADARRCGRFVGTRDVLVGTFWWPKGRSSPGRNYEMVV